jgi:sulfatase-like protein
LSTTSAIVSRPRAGRLAWREFAIAWVHLVVLWSFAFAQPLFGVLEDSPEFFVARGNTGGDVLILAFGMVLIPPTAMLLAELVLVAWPRLRRALHLLFVGGLAAALALQLLKGIANGPTVVLVLLAIAAGTCLAVAYQRTRGVPAVLTVLAPAPVLFVVLFFTSGVSELFRSDDNVPVRADVRAGAPVVMLVMDEFSVELLMDEHRRIDATRFPNFAALTKSATWYRNATTIADHTTDAVPGVLSGRYPSTSSLPIASDYPHNLFTLLGGAYSMSNVDEPATDLCPERLCGERSRAPQSERLHSLAHDLTIVSLHKLVPQGLEHRLPAVDTAFANFGGGGDTAASTAMPGGEVQVPARAFDDRAAQFQRFAQGIDASGPKANVSFLHVLLPHTPWQYLPNGQRYLTGTDELPGIEGGVWPATNDAPGRLAYQRTILQAGYMDRLLGDLMRRMRSQGVWDRSLFALVADHGISFRPGASRRSAVGNSAPDIFGMPMFIKLPDQAHGAIDDDRATTADVLPTIADALGINLRWHTDGVSLLNAARSTAPVSVATFPTRERTTMSLQQYVSGRDAEVKGMRSRLGDQPGWDAVYALGPDGDLFGAPVAPLQSGELAGASAHFDDAGAFAAVDPHAAVVPSFVRASLSGPIASGQRVAVAVNGTVRGVSRAFQSNGQTRLGAMVPPSSFKGGKNDVRVYAITGDGEARRLQEIAGG